MKSEPYPLAKSDDDSDAGAAGTAEGAPPVFKPAWEAQSDEEDEEEAEPPAQVSSSSLLSLQVLEGPWALS